MNWLQLLTKPFPFYEPQTTNRELFINGGWVSIIMTVPTLQVLKPISLGYIPRKGKRFSSSSNHANRIWNPQSLLFNGCRG
jgi:hypothetical protein